MKAEAPRNSTSPDDFRYSAKTDTTNWSVTYRAQPDSWSLRLHIPASNVSATIDVELELKTQTPYGYLPLATMGWENENLPWTGQPDPSTMNSLSYYYGRPKANAKVTVKIGNTTSRITGSLCFEHQWGNFVYWQEPWITAYVWSAFQFDDGSIFTLRQWYDQQNPPQPLLNAGRYSYSTHTICARGGYPRTN